jgi:hypothetical protein
MRRSCCSLALALALVLASVPALAGISLGGPGRGGAVAIGGAKVILVPEGDPDGSGDATLFFDTRRGQICFDIDLDDVESVVAVHIHAGEVGQSNEDLLLVDLDFANQGLGGCARAGKELVRSILDNLDSKDPAAFYLHVHSAAFSTGAVRGQIEKD